MKDTAAKPRPGRREPAHNQLCTTSPLSGARWLCRSLHARLHGQARTPPPLVTCRSRFVRSLRCPKDVSVSKKRGLINGPRKPIDRRPFPDSRREKSTFLPDKAQSTPRHLPTHLYRNFYNRCTKVFICLHSQATLLPRRILQRSSYSPSMMKTAALALLAAGWQLAAAQTLDECGPSSNADYQYEVCGSVHDCCCVMRCVSQLLIRPILKKPRDANHEYPSDT